MKEKENNKWGLESPLKKYSAETIENTISKSLSELAGEKVEINIKSIDFTPNKKEISLGNPVEIRLVSSSPIEGWLK